MRKLFISLAALTVALGLAGIAGAAPMQWEGTGVVRLGDFPQGTLTGGGVATINGSGGLGHLNSLRLSASRGNIKGTLTLPVTDPEVAGNAIAVVLLDNIQGGTGTFAPISGAASSAVGLSQNTLPIRGIARLCLVNTDCTQTLPITLTEPTPGTPGVKGVGVGGLVGAAQAFGAIRISLENAPWTIKTVTVIDHQETPNGSTFFTGVTLKGFVHDPLSSTSGTAAPSGLVQLVTPVQVTTNLPFGSNDKISAGATLVIHFIPEPGLLLLLGSGVAGLALLGHRRMRR